MGDRRQFYQKGPDGTMIPVESPMRSYQRRYESMHPDKVLRWRLNSYIRALKQNGYTVVKDGDPV